MKTNFKLSSKLHLFIIISSLIIALGLAVGTVCHFVADGYFNYGSDWGSYKSVTVSYENVEFSSEETVTQICDKAFSDAGIKSFSRTFGDTSTGGEIVYKFVCSTDDTKLSNAVVLIKAAIDERGTESGGITLSTASTHNAEALLVGGKALKMFAITLASVIAFHFVYFVIRYKLTMALAAVLADVHNLALFVSLLALIRVPVGTAMLVFALLTVLLTMIGTCVAFDRIRKNIKDENFVKLAVEEQVDRGFAESFVVNLFLPCCVAAVAVLLFVFTAISSLSLLAIISPAICALLMCAVCFYGTALFTPSVYSRFKKIGDNFKAKRINTARVKPVKQK